MVEVRNSDSLTFGCMWAVHPEKIKSNKRIMPSNEYFSKIENLAILIPPLFFDNVNLTREK